MQMRVLFIVGAVAVAVPLAITANGGRGALDPTFGAKGLVDVRVGNRSGAQDALAQPDGKVVLAGFAADSTDTTISDFLAIRLNRNGSLDESFGAKGIVRTRSIPGTESRAPQMRLRSRSGATAASSWPVRPTGAATHSRLYADRSTRASRAAGS